MSWLTTLLLPVVVVVVVVGTIGGLAAKQIIDKTSANKVTEDGYVVEPIYTTPTPAPTPTAEPAQVQGQVGDNTPSVDNSNPGPAVVVVPAEPTPPPYDPCANSSTVLPINFVPHQLANGPMDNNPPMDNGGGGSQSSCDSNTYP